MLSNIDVDMIERDRTTQELMVIEWWRWWDGVRVANPQLRYVNAPPQPLLRGETRPIMHAFVQM